MKRLFFAAALLVAAVLAPANTRADELPNFCTAPTAEELANIEIQKACADLKEIDKAMEALRKMMTNMQQLMTTIEQTDSKLQNDIRRALPAPRSRPRAQDHIPSHPSEVQRHK